MKDNYHRDIALRCATCGSSSDFEYNDDKSYVKCRKCNREYHGGYDELVELNQAHIQAELDDMKAEVEQDAAKYLQDSLKKAFKGNKFIKFK